MEPPRQARFDLDQRLANQDHVERTYFEARFGDQGVIAIEGRNVRLLGLPRLHERANDVLSV